jgi:hypothetical protein
MKRMITVSLLALFTGCSALLPSARQSTRSPWKNYGDAQQAFAQIEPGQTSREQLYAMGFNPQTMPNITLMNYLDVTRLFIPNESIGLGDLHPDLQACLQAKSRCHGYAINTGFVFRERYGNTLLDVFNFHRKTKTTGWQFQGWVILNNGLVVYKLAGGKPNIEEVEDKRNPLGPLQDISLPSDLLMK